MSKRKITWKDIVWIPGYWCEPTTASVWLREQGWKVGKKRAAKRGVSIPAPQPRRLYDLHDVVCEMDVGASVVVGQIRAFAKSDGVAGRGAERGYEKWLREWEAGPS